MVELLIVTAVGMSLCAGFMHADTISAKNAATSPEESYFLYARATYDHRSGDLGKALVEYHELMSSTAPLCAQEGYVKALFDAQKFQELIALPADIFNRLEDIAEIGVMRAQSYLCLRQPEPAGKIFERLIKKFPQNEQVIYHATVYYLMINQPLKALAFLNSLLENKHLGPKHAIFYFLKAKTLVLLHDPQQALIAIEKSVQLCPLFEQSWILSGMLHEQLGNISKAIDGYTKFLDLVGSHSAVEKHIVGLLVGQKRFEEAADRLKKMPDSSPEHFFDLAVISWQAKEYQQAETALQKALAKNPDFKRARLFMVGVLQAQKKKGSLLSFFRDWIAHHSAEQEGLEALLSIRNGPLRRTEVINILEALCRTKKTSLRIAQALADLYLEQKDYKRAATYANRALAFTHDAAIASRINFQIGYICHLSREDTEAEKALLSAIRVEPAYPSAYNLLAYLYAQRGKDLPQALLLINKALAREPNSPSFLDTKGYILMKMNNIPAAVNVLERAALLAPHDTTIKTRLADAHNKQSSR